MYGGVVVSTCSLIHEHGNGRMWTGNETEKSSLCWEEREGEWLGERILRVWSILKKVYNTKIKFSILISPFLFV